MEDLDWMNDFSFISVDHYVVVTQINGKIISHYPDRIKKLIEILTKITDPQSSQKSE